MSFPKYPEYRDSGVEWLGSVPSQWRTLRLRNISSVNPRKSETSNLPRETEVTFLPMESIGTDGKINLENSKPISELEGGYTYFRDSDVVIAKITPCFENFKGAIVTGLKNGCGFGTTELIVVRPSTQITSKFLNSIFLSNQFRSTGESSMYGAGGQKRVPDDFVKDYKIALPSLEEQVLISDFLDHETAKIDSLISEQEKLIELLKEKRQAVISHAVTKGLDPTVKMKDSGVEWLGEVPEHWEVKKGAYVGRLFGSEQIAEDGISDVGAVPFLKVSSLSEHSFEIQSWDWFITEEVAQGTHTRNNYIVFPKRGAAIFLNKVNIVRQPSVIDPNLMGWQMFEFADIEYIAFALRARKLDELADISTVPQINNKHIYPEKFPLPPLSEQLEIVTFLNTSLRKTDTLITESELAIALLEERRSALISAAVTGQIDVRDFKPQAQAA
jgi:type I restriction enzyme S subunit